MATDHPFAMATFRPGDVSSCQFRRCAPGSARRADFDRRRYTDSAVYDGPSCAPKPGSTIPTARHASADELEIQRRWPALKMLPCQLS